MSRKFLLSLCPFALALLASGTPSAKAQDFETSGTGVVGSAEVHGAAVPEPSASALMAIGGGLAVMAMLRRPPGE